MKAEGKSLMPGSIVWVTGNIHTYDIDLRQLRVTDTRSKTLQGPGIVANVFSVFISVIMLNGLSANMTWSRKEDFIVLHTGYNDA